MKERGRFEKLIFLNFHNWNFYRRWYVEPTETMKQKVKSDAEASLDKTTNTTTKSSSNLPHSHSITGSIKSPSESTSTVPTNLARVS
jgi:hypothetical protein